MRSGIVGQTGCPSLFRARRDRGPVGWLVVAGILALMVSSRGPFLEAAQDGAGRGGPNPEAAFSIVEASIADLQTALTAGRVTSRELVERYLARIDRLDPVLHAVLSLNPAALQDADRLDRERRLGRLRGPLHGIPVAVKDNIQTADMPTTGGALAFAGFVPDEDATLVTRLREAGAIILAKTDMTELANWVAGAPTPMPGNYNAISGFGMNPYDPRPDPRASFADGRPVVGTGGSSSGVGTAASFWAASVGTETSGSILSPANQTMLAAIKPTVGRISRRGIIPLTADQDTAGPMARTVADAATLLGVLEGDDPGDPQTARCEPPAGDSYAPFLRRDGLAGARIGIPRAYFYEPQGVAGGGAPRGGLTRAEREVMDTALMVLRREGADVVDPANVPSVVAPNPDDNLLRWNICAGAADSRGQDAECSVVLKYGMKRDFTRWLQGQTGAPVASLTALRAFNLDRQEAGAVRFGQSRLDISDEVDLVADRERYLADRAKDLRLTATEGLDAVLAAHALDALLFPAFYGYDLAARPGYPTVIVPFGFVPNEPRPPLPSGFEAKAMPFGVSFVGAACAEPRLIELAFAFEQATQRRVPPDLR